MVVPSASRGQNSGDGVRFRASHMVDDGFVRGTDACPSRIRCQAATGSWTESRQWET